MSLKIQRIFSQIISVLFHPLLMPTFGIFLIFNSIAILSYNAQYVILLVVASTTFVLPLTMLPFFAYKKIVNNVKMDTAKERILPLAVTVIFFLFSFYILYARLSPPRAVLTFILASVISVSITLIVTLKYKISAHMVGVGGIIGLLIVLSLKYMIDLQHWIMIMFVISGVVAYARLRLNAHTPMQVVFGFLTGLFVVFITFLLY